MRQQEAKQVAERLLFRRVKMKQKNGKCLIFPSTTRGRLIETSTFSKTTDYWGLTWDEAVAKIEAHVRYNPETGQPFEAELIRCPNCGEHEALDYDEVLRQFSCESCGQHWTAESGVSIVAEDAPPQLDREGEVAQTILIPQGMLTEPESNGEPEANRSPEGETQTEDRPETTSPSTPTNPEG
jgi:hypothetical protein